MEEPRVPTQKEGGGKTCQVMQLGDNNDLGRNLVVGSSGGRPTMKLPVVAGDCKFNSPAVAGGVKADSSVKADVDLGESLVSDARQDANLSCGELPATRAGAKVSQGQLFQDHPCPENTNSGKDSCVNPGALQKFLSCMTIPVSGSNEFCDVCRTCCQFSRSWLQLGITLCQLLLSSPRDGIWIRSFVTKVSKKAPFTPCRRSRDIFPIPIPPVGAVLSLIPLFDKSEMGLFRVSNERLKSMGSQQRKKRVAACSMQVWRFLNVMVLNGEACDWRSLDVSCYNDPPSAPQRLVWDNITRCCSYFASSPLEVGSEVSFSELVRSKALDYAGDEVSHALPLKLAELLPGLPDPIVAGSLDAAQVAKEDVKRWLLDPYVTLKPKEQWPSKPRQVRINCRVQEWYEICGELFKRNIVAPIPERDIFSVNGVPVLNGAFAVLKKGKAAPGESRVTRLIMNLVPSNDFQTLQKGDMATLASATSWCALNIPESHVLLWSGDDQRGAFYAWRLPVAWRPFMAFKWPVPGRVVNQPHCKWCFVAASVIPMGWINAVPLFQHLHRQLGIGEQLGSANHPPQAEWRRDRPVPKIDPCVQTFWVQYYLDDFDCPELLPLQSWKEFKGVMSPVHLSQRKAYDEIGVGISEDKAHIRDPVVVRMGAEIDGLLGMISAPKFKILEACWFALWTASLKQPLNKCVLMVLGRFVRIFEFRRPLMSILGKAWPRGSVNWRAPLSPTCLSCLLRACAASTLALTDLRTPIDGMVSSTDASEAGGGLCVSGELTDEGKAMLQSLSNPMAREETSFQAAGAMPSRSPGGARVFVVSLFDGISAIMAALSRLECAVVGFASSEIDKECRKLTRKRWPGIIELGNVENIDEKMIIALAHGLGYQVDVVLLTAGSPCQDLSALLAGGLGLDGPRSKLFFHIPRILKLLQQHFVCPVHSFVENVFSMTQENRERFSEALGCKPTMIDASYFSWCHRPRLFWASWVITPCENESMVEHGDYMEWIFPTVRSNQPDWLDDGCDWPALKLLPTLTRSLPRKKPPLRPAGLESASAGAVKRWTEDEFRFQIYQYEEENLVMAGNQLRTPSVTEREVLMGFDRGYVSKALSPKLTSSQAFDVGACMLGNTFNVHVIVMLAHSLLTYFGGSNARDHQQLISHVGAAPAGWTAYPKFRQKTKPDSAAVSLVSEFLRRAEKGGSDVRLDLGIPFRIKAFPRAALRTSLFWWKIVHGYSWRHPAHINCLELQAISNGLQWRLRKCARFRKRVLHLVDSQVWAAIVAKGRTSSHRLKRALKKLNCLLLASGTLLTVGYVHTTDNPADIPSRWSDRKKKPQPCDVSADVDAP